jgi:hypothetical protein
MKNYNIYKILIAVLVVFISSCEKGKIEDRGIFITSAAESPLGSITIDNTGGSIGLTTSSSTLMDKDIVITYVSDSNAVHTYNIKNKTNFKPLPQKFFNLSKNSANILAGTSISNAIELKVLPFDNTIKDGDQYMIPIEIHNTSSDIPVIEASRILYVAINRVLVNSALDAGSGSFAVFAMPDPIKDLTQFTVEMRVRNTAPFVNNMTLFSAGPSEIYSRFGDVVIKPNQLQIKYAGIQPASATEFSQNKWYHIAYVFEGATNSFKIYVDGKLDGTTSAPAGTKFNLDKMEFGNRVQVQELRFWTKVRTEVEIKGNMCAVSPASDNLYGYWKFNEGAGNKIADVTGHGHDGTITGTAKWIQGVRCPE